MIDHLRNLIARLRERTPPPPVVQEFDGPDAYHSEALSLRMRRPIVAGSIVMLVFVLGLFVWAAVSPIYGAVMAPGTVKVEGYSKEIRHLDPGIIRQILVHEGQHVVKGQLLVRFDDVSAVAAVQIYQAAADAAHAQIARLQAEAANRDTIEFPADLLARRGDPTVAALLESQRNLLLSTNLLYHGQADSLRNQAMQLGNQISGVQAQVASTDGQSGLIQEELRGVQALNKEGYAPRTRLLALERSAVALKGQRGSQVADIARARQSFGQIRIQLAQLEDRRMTEAADGIRTAQQQLTELEPKLHAGQESLNQITMRSPVDGYVFGLTQRTEGSVASMGELLMSIVPSDSPLAIILRVKPMDVTQVKVGMPARVMLSAYNPRTTPQVQGKVELVSADATDDPQAKESFYQVRVTVSPAELAKAGPGVKLSPGMPAMVSIVTGKRTILDYLLSPLTESMHSSLRER
jgi:HlyD family secretion protein